MIALEDRQALVRDITVAHRSRAWLRVACAIARTALGSLQRWQAWKELEAADGRALAVRAAPAHPLSA